VAVSVKRNQRIQSQPFLSLERLAVPHNHAHASVHAVDPAKLDLNASVSAPSTVSMHAVRVLFGALGRAGVAKPKVLQAIGLSEAQLEQQDARLPIEEVQRIAEHGIELSGDPAFGLHWAESMSVETFAPISYLVAHAATLGEGLDALLHFSRLVSDQSHIEVQRVGDAARLVVQPMAGTSPRILRLTAELTVFSFLRILQSFSTGFRPERVCFAYPPPSYAKEYSRVFNCPVYFEQTFTGVSFDSALLSARAAYRDRSVHEAVRALAERRIALLDDTYAQRVRELLVQRGRVGGPAMIDVATKLELSVHALRRRLAAEGTSFGVLEQQAFAILVRNLLIDRQRSIQEAAFELGFSGTVAFHRAFKRAMGTTPRAFLQGS
jgi:AraC-like DNA-binding protein